MTRSKDNPFGIKTTPLGTAISRKNRGEVLELVREGGLEQDEGLLARLVGEMSPDVYMEASNKVGDLSPDAVGLGIIAAFQRGDVMFAMLLRAEKPNANLNVQNRNGITPLMAAVYGGNIVMARYLIDSGADISLKDTSGNSVMDMIHILQPDIPIGSNDVEGLLEMLTQLENKNQQMAADRVVELDFLKAVEDGDINAVQSFLESGININTIDEEGLTAVMIAAENGHTNLISLLLDRGANLSATDYEGQNALMHAAKGGSVGAVKQLIAAGADLNAREEDGLTALMLASTFRHPEVVELLCKQEGIEVDAVSEDGYSALMYAARVGDVKSINSLIAHGADINQVDEKGRTPLMYAARLGHIEAVKLFLAHDDIQVNAKDESGKVALLMAVKAEHDGIIKLLSAQKGIQVDAVDKRGNTALVHELKKGNIDTVSALVKAGADVNYVNPNDFRGRTPLMLAVRSGNLAITQLLIGKGAAINTQNKLGTTSLMYAAMSGNADMVDALIKAGAAVNAVNLDGKTVFEFAKKRENVIAVLIANGVYSLYTAIENNRLDIAQQLIDKGAAVDGLHPTNGSTPLMAAAALGNIAAMDFLIGKGADINAKDPTGFTVLMAAAKGSREAVAKIATKDNINAVDQHGGTALTYSKTADIMKELISRGADPYLAGLIKEDNGVTVVDERVTDKEMRDVLLGYVQAEKEFEKKFADRIVAAIKTESISFFTDGVNNKIQEIVTKVLKEEGKSKFAHAVKRGGAEAPKIELAVVDKFVIALQAILPDSWVESSMQAVKEQLNAAVQKMEVFKPLSTELEKEVKSFADRVKGGQSEVVR